MNSNFILYAMREIYLPELASIRLQNFTLYPNGLNYEYNFVKGVNLILGGNGMGKTTFVNIIKYAIIGNYKKSLDLTRTYREQAIVKRRLNPSDYFRNRMDKTLILENKASVGISFFINNIHIYVERCLETVSINSFSVNGAKIDGEIITQDKYEFLKDDIRKENNTERKKEKETDLEKYLLYKYEIEIEKYSNLSFDDLIFFVNEILFFGEDHKTILWKDEGDLTTSVQDELFNKYFNSPELDKERQEALRLARYYDSLSRHRSEDIRAINKVLKKIDKTTKDKGDVTNQIISQKDDIAQIDQHLIRIQNDRLKKEKNTSINQNLVNRLSFSMNDIEKRKNIAENKFVNKAWQASHPQYDIFIKNIKNNNICPMCNQFEENLVQKVLTHPDNCFVCNTKFKKIEDPELEKEYHSVLREHNETHNQIQNTLLEISRLETEISILDKQFINLSIKKRNNQSKLRLLEFQKTQEQEISELQAFYDEILRLEQEKEENQEKSKQELLKADEIFKSIEAEIIKNVRHFSSLFSSFAEKFLGVECSLTYENIDGTSEKRFYPVIDKTIRKNQEELSESQRFFVDHSFRMSILSFFYTKPTFYIVETPDSSLDISYEENAANVFLNFLKQPNCVIITSNLNNSLFVNHIINNDEQISVALIGLPDIAKKSIIQNMSDTLINIYNSLKNKINQKNEL